MSHHRLAAGSAYPRHGVAERRPLARHITRFAALEIAVEGLLHRARMSLLDQVAGDVGAADDRPLRQRAGAFVDAADAALFETAGYFFTAPYPECAQPLQTLRQRGGRADDPETDDVQQLMVPGHRQLHTRDYREPRADRRALRLDYARGRVVIGEGQHVHAPPAGMRYQRRRTQGAVGCRRMAMQVIKQICAHHRLSGFSITEYTNAAPGQGGAKCAMIAPLRRQCASRYHTMKFLFDFLPILLFFIAIKLYDKYVATAVAMAVYIAQVGWSWTRHSKVDNMQWVTLGLIVVLGGLTLFLNDETFIKWKPTLVNWLFAAAVLVSQYIVSKSILQRMMAANITLPEPIWRRLNWLWVGFFSVLCAVYLYVAYNYDTATWVNFKLFGMMGLTILFVIAQGLYLSRHLKADEGT